MSHIASLPDRYDQYEQCYHSSFDAWNALLNPFMWIALGSCESIYGIGLHPENFANELSVEDRVCSGLSAAWDTVDTAFIFIPLAKGLSAAGKTGVVMARGVPLREARAIVTIDDMLRYGSLKPLPLRGQLLFPEPLVLEGRVVRVQNWLSDTPLSSVSFYNKGLIGEYSAGYWLGPEYVYHPAPIYIHGQLRRPDFVRYYPGTKQIAEIVEVKNVSYLHRMDQITDGITFAEKNEIRYTIMIDSRTRVSGPLSEEMRKKGFEFSKKPLNLP